MTRFVRYLSAALTVVGVVVFTESRMDTRAQEIDPCAAATDNPVACENTRPGNPASEWDIVGAGDPAIQGFATDASVNRGETVYFKVNTPSSFRIDIYRLGYYAGLGARLVATLAGTPKSQDPCISDSSTGLVDCGNWSESSSWAVPETSVSGIYLAKLVRTDATAGSSHIVFVVRDDTGASDLLLQTSDTTWQAYNQYGGNSLYVGSPAGRAYKVSYNRPYTTRETSPEDWVFNAEYPMVRWLEANGYDVSYTSGIDTDRRGAELKEHKVFLSVGHDEYWSGDQRQRVEEARAAGVHLAFFSGNEVYWKTRYEASIDGNATPYRTLVSYKETHAGAKIDPSPEWTGTWRDARFSPPADGGKPENSLTGTLFMVNGPSSIPLEVPAEYGALRFWRNTTIATMVSGTAVLSDATVGYEWDEAPSNGFQPEGLIRLSKTTASVAGKLQDNGSTFGPGTATHSLTLYRDAASQALVFGAGTVQWSWGLDGTHDRGGSVPDLRMQQATVNLLADMAALPLTPHPSLTVSAVSTDATRPSSTITLPVQSASLPVGTAVTITGTASDAGGGVVAAVEVSADGMNWITATGTSSWTATWTPALLGTVTLISRAVDDSGNMETPGGGIGVTVSPAVPVSCPCTIWPDTTTPGIADVGPENAVELGVKFRSDISGYITSLKFYKGAGNTGLHKGSLWTASGLLLASVTFVNETASGWQTALLPTPIQVSADTTYVASYHTTTGHYAADNGYFGTGVDRAPLHALADSVSVNGVYRYGPGGFPNQSFQASNYWVDVVFAETVVDTSAPVVSLASPRAGSVGVSLPSQITAAFNEPVDAATINASTFEVRAPGGVLVPGAVTYDSATYRAVFTVSAAMAYNSSYTATLRGGAAAPRVTDNAGNALAANYVWTFTTGAAPPPPPDQGSGGPILVVSFPGNPFSRYYAEILHAEGLNAFAVSELSTVTAASLAAYDIVLLGEMPLTSAQVTMFSTWVNGGGQLIAMRPDKQLAPLLGIADAAATLSDQYLLLNTTSGPGVGLVNESIQFHGTADLYALSDAASLATLYTGANAPTTRPAITLRQVGSAGGQAAAFTYDLAKSVVFTRQGNPAWTGQERDGTAPIRSDDLFFGGGVVADWVDLSKVAIPQADEQQRMLANLMLQMSSRRKPMPRFWYFPRDLKAVVIMTGDDHGNNGTSGRFNQYGALSAPGCSVEDWECIRSTSYIYPNTPLTESAAAGYRAAGFEIGVHVTTGCLDFTPASLAANYAAQLDEFRAKYVTLPSPATNRTHCIAWSDYATQPQVEFDSGIRFDTNYYYWPGTWLLDKPGVFTGSGMPMRFATATGAMIDVYQAATQLTDESGQSMAAHVGALFDGALGPNGYYGAFTANMHTDSATSAGSDVIVTAAIARNVPVVSAEQMLEWLDGRNASTFRSLAWDGTALTFSIEIGSGARGLRAMLPARSGSALLTSLTAGGSPVAFVRETIKGVEYATFMATPVTYLAVYDFGAPETTITAAPPATSSSASATFQFSSTLAGSTFRCSRDGAVFTACTSPSTYSALSDGAHTFSVQAVSATGVADPTPAAHTWTVDATAPVITGVSVVPTTTIAVLAWTTDEPSDSVVQYGTSTAVLLNVSNPSMVLSHSMTLTGLSPGTTYYYRIASKNAAGLSGYSPSATGASSFATVAIVPPNTTMTSTPAVVTSATSATFQFTATIAGSTFQCSRDGAAYSACASPLTYSALAAGTHTFSVRAVNAGLTDATPASFTWTIDTTPPVFSGIVMTPAVTTAVIRWATNEPADSLVEYATSATSPVLRVSSASLVLNHNLTLTGLTGGTTYYYRITARNAAGLSAWTPVGITAAFVTRTQVSQAPASVVIQTGSYRSGTASNLSANDGSRYQVNSITSGSLRTASWYGSLTGVTNSLGNLTVAYAGGNSVNATQVIEIWDWSRSVWVSLNSRTVGSTEVLVSNLVPAGTAANYVSGTTGSGEVRVRIRSTAGSTSFYSSGNYLRIGFDRP